MKLLTSFLSLCLAMLMYSSTTYAQRNIKPKKKVETVVLKADSSKIMFDNLLPATAKIIIIDSIVVAYDSIYDNIPLRKELGTISQKDGTVIYQNGFNNRRYISRNDSTGHSKLYSSELLGDKWSEPRKIEIDGNFTDLACPFMMSDGVTLYFAAKGKETLGGYDTFVTMFDSDDNRFMKPENNGLPFNSTANDYFFITDDIDSLAWLVSSRNQPRGKVCIYTFIPYSSRTTYNQNYVTHPQLTKLAKISNIKDTWTDMSDVNDALTRLQKLKSTERNEGKEDYIDFVINDNVTYHNINEFRSATNKNLFKQLMDKKQAAKELENSLNDMRNAFDKDKEDSLSALRQNILESETKLQNIRIEINNLEKSIRNTENVLYKQGS
jgi:hypothetical protein